MIYQNPDAGFLNLNWDKLVESLPNWEHLINCPKEMEFKFDDETGSWSNKEATGNVKFDYLWNKIK